jgi:hypothetical protein
MNLELDDTEWPAPAELLTAEIKGTTSRWRHGCDRSKASLQSWLRNRWHPSRCRHRSRRVNRVDFVTLKCRRAGAATIYYILINSWGPFFLAVCGSFHGSLLPKLYRRLPLIRRRGRLVGVN